MLWLLFRSEVSGVFFSSRIFRLLQDLRFDSELNGQEAACGSGSDTAGVQGVVAGIRED
jgi:tetrahydromethanopterin S-methyltransferase subunit F